MSGTVKFSVVAPMHNEEGNVRPLYEQIRCAMEALQQPYEILFVNDASTDETLGAMRRISKDNPHFHYVDLEFNVGENWALQAGISKAVGEIIITMDGDGQNDPAYIPQLVQRLSAGFRVVSGWRQNRVGNLWTRRLPSAVANTLIRWLTGVPVHDCGCGLKIYRREVVEKRFVPKGFMNRFSPVVFGVKANEFSEVAIVDRVRNSGRSHYGIGRVFVVFRDLWALPFAIRGPNRWLARFRWIEWISLGALALLAFRGYRSLALVALGVALLAFSNVSSLKRFVRAEIAPEFRAREFR